MLYLLSIQAIVVHSPTSFFQSSCPSPSSDEQPPAGAQPRRCLERDTPVGAVLEEDAAVDLALVDAGLLGALVDDVAGVSGGLLEHAHLELAKAGVVVGHGRREDGLERRGGVGGVEDLERAVSWVWEWLASWSVTKI